MWTVGGWVSDPSYLGRDAGEGLGQQPVEGVGQPGGGQAAGQQEPDMIRIIFTGSYAFKVFYLMHVNVKLLGF